MAKRKTKPAKAKVRGFKKPAARFKKPAARLKKPKARLKASTRRKSDENLLYRPPRIAACGEVRHLSHIKVGKRHRVDYGDVAGLARSIDERGALLQPIVIDKDNKLIAGERRMRAWPLTKLSDKGRLPIPVHVVEIDAIIAGEWDENAQRKNFTPSEAAAISAEIERKLKVLAGARQKSGKKVAAHEKGRAADKAAKVTGFDRKTIDKAREVVEAAKQDPEKFGKLKADMDRTGKVSGPHKRLQNIRQGEQLRNAPPGVPMNGPYQGIIIDWPWPHEPDATQEEIDAAGRSLRPYAAMSIQEMCRFAAEKIKPIMAENCSVGMWVTNFHMRHAFQVLHALGIDQHSTIETWDKVKIGRGQVRRDRTEHMIIALKGKPTLTLTNESTIYDEPRRENSRKPDKAYARFEAVHPAPRYAEIFSRGGRGPKWDCHGDQVGAFAAGDAPAAEQPADRKGKKSGRAPRAKRSTPASAELDAATLARPCRVCQLTSADKRHWPESTLCDECAPAGVGHVVNRHNDATHWIATCECGGFDERVAYGVDMAKAKLDEAVRAHWQSVVSKAEPAPPADAPRPLSGEASAKADDPLPAGGEREREAVQDRGPQLDLVRDTALAVAAPAPKAPTDVELEDVPGFLRRKQA